MESTNFEQIIVETVVHAQVEKVWKYWTEPFHIMHWNYASPDWHTPQCENDLSVGGKFTTRMEAKDGSFGFDFWGIYDVIETNKLIEYTLGDTRKVSITFSTNGEETKVIETFEAEETNPLDMQKTGWQNIMDNFKKYVEEH